MESHYEQDIIQKVGEHLNRLERLVKSDPTTARGGLQVVLELVEGEIRVREKAFEAAKRNYPKGLNGRDSEDATVWREYRRRAEELLGRIP